MINDIQSWLSIACVVDNILSTTQAIDNDNSVWYALYIMHTIHCCRLVDHMLNTVVDSTLCVWTGAIQRGVDGVPGLLPCVPHLGHRIQRS